MHEIFLSYASSDLEVAEWMCAALEQAAFRCWFAKRDVSPGAHWAREIWTAIANARVFIVVLTPRANASDHVFREVECAASRRLRLLGVRIENFELRDEYQYFLNTVQWLSLPRGVHSSDGDKQLVRAVSALMPSKSERVRGKRFGPYTILQREEDGTLHEMGRGAAGSTYLGVDERDGRSVALKLVDPVFTCGDAASAHLLESARAATPLRHENIAAVRDPGQAGLQHFYASELAEGEALHLRLRRNDKLAVDEAVSCGAQVAGALVAAECAGIVHGNLKPSKLIAHAEAGSGLHIKVIGFGFPSDLESFVPPAATAQVPINAKFSSPEQLLRTNFDSRSDFYSLGITLWYLLSGTVPFAGGLAEIAFGHQRSPLPWTQLPDIPKDLRQLLVWLLEKEPHRRPASATALLQAFHAILERADAPRVALGRPASPDLFFSLPLEEETMFKTLIAQGPGDPSSTPGEDGHPPEPEVPGEKGEWSEDTHTFARRPSADLSSDELPEHDRFTSENLIGRGGMARVFGGVFHGIAAPAALKVYDPNLPHSLRESIERQLRKVALLRHRNIARVYEVGHLDEALYCIMELASGSILDLRKKLGPLAPRQALEIMKQVAQALAAAAVQGVIHGDLKPGNILMAKGDASSILLVDFDLGALDDDEDICRRSSVYTPVYASPEVLTGGVRDCRGDIYSWGAALWSLVNGRPPFSDLPADKIIESKLGQPVPAAQIAHLPKSLQTLLLRCLEIDPSDRPQTPDDLLSAIEEVCGGSENPQGNQAQSRKAEPEPKGDSSRGDSADAGLSDIVTVAAFVPRPIPSRRFVVEVWLYSRNAAEEVRELASAGGRSHRAGCKAGVRIPRHSELTVELELSGAHPAAPAETVYWAAEPVNAAFVAAPIPAGETVIGRILVRRDGGRVVASIPLELEGP